MSAPPPHTHTCIFDVCSDDFEEDEEGAGQEEVAKARTRIIQNVNGEQQPAIFYFASARVYKESSETPVIAPQGAEGEGSLSASYRASCCISATHPSAKHSPHSIIDTLCAVC